MADAPNEFGLLMERVRAGCPDATAEVFHRYSPHIRRIARRRLHQRLRAQFDSQDFAQAVWASFFLTPADRYTFETPDQLMGFLARLTCHKVVEAARQRLGTRKYDAAREVPLAQLAHLDRDHEYVPAGRDPTPSQVAIANERWERLLSGQPPHARRALELLRDGMTQREVAARVGLSCRSVKRLLDRLQERNRLA
jgi:RNA polymerase sigma factor (sigma-70 family)